MMDVNHQETSDTMDHKEGSPRKRPRLDDFVEVKSDPDVQEPGNSTAEPAPVYNGPPIVKDDIYYKDDGDTVIRIQNVLFKVHRSLLERDSSTFSDMFIMPQGNSVYEPFSDENPLILDDSVEDFRALCWVSYALPTVFKDQMSSETADIEKLVACFIIVRKYHFDSHEEWARGLLETHLRKTDRPRVTDYFLNCPESRLEELLRTAHEGNTPELRESVYTIWLHRLEVKPDEPITFALNAAERFNDRIFQGELLYKEMTRIEVLEVEGSTAHLSDPKQLSLNQKMTLFQGYWSLQHYWDCTVRKSLHHSFACPATHTCSREWKRIWREHIAKRLDYEFDPVGFLVKLTDDLNKAKASECPCARSKLDEMAQDLDDTLQDHFLGVEPAVADPE